MSIIASWCWKCESVCVFKYGRCLKCNPEPEPKERDKDLEEQGQQSLLPDAAA